MLRVTRAEVWVFNWIYWTTNLIATNNYNNLTELHTSKVTVTAAHTTTFQYTLSVIWWLLPIADVSLPLCSPNVHCLRYSGSHFGQLQLKVKVEVMLGPTVFTVSCRCLYVGHLLWPEIESVVFGCCWASPRHSPYFTASNWRLPNLQGQVPVFISSRNRIA
jgi:hypothetical protein